MSSTRPIDIIVPIYGAAESLARCLESLGRTVDFGKHRVLLVLDGPQSTEVESSVAAFAADRDSKAVVLLRPERRQGYPAAVQRGIDEGASLANDVVLLNSDTVVAGHWIENLSSAAASSARLATVTPFTNNGTLASLPRPFEINRLPSGLDVEGFARIVKRYSRRRYPRIPTAVGFCMLVKRAALDDVGGFDVAAFGLGYGEEVDFCLRASAAGWEHCLDDATFVFHEGQSSFGKQRDRRVRAAERLLARRFPLFRRDLAAFMREDPLALAREPILEALDEKTLSDGVPRRSARSAIVHIVHGWPPENFAGTEMYAWWLVHAQHPHKPVSVYTRSADRQFATGTAVELYDRGVRVRALVNHFDQRNPLRRNGLRDHHVRSDFARFLDQTRPELLHLHHLAGHGFSIFAEARARRLPVLLQLQDWWLLCARANLLNRDRQPCPGPELDRCADCLPLTRATSLTPLDRLLTQSLYRGRRALARAALASADALVAGSTALVDSFRELGYLPEGVPVHIVPYGVDGAQAIAHRVPRLPLRVGFVGSLLPHKGLHLLTAAASGLPPGSLDLEIWGDPTIDPQYVQEAIDAGQGATIHLRGRFREEDRASILTDLDLLVAPSLGLESYGFAAREALAAGLPVLASRRGALAEIFGDSGRRGEACGEHFDPERPEELAGLLQRLAADPHQLTRWRKHAPRMPTLAEHLAQLEPIYEQLLSSRSSTTR